MIQAIKNKLFSYGVILNKSQFSMSRKWSTLIFKFKWNFNLKTWPEFTLCIGNCADEKLSLYIGLPLVRLSFYTDLIPDKLVNLLVGKPYKGSSSNKAYCVRRYGFYSCKSHVQLYFHRDDSGMTLRTGYEYHISFERLLKGSTTYCKPEVIEKRSLMVTIPAFDSYEKQEVVLHITKKRHRTIYSRWPEFVFYRFDVVPSEPSLHAGKGENSWDQDPRELSSISFGSDCTSFEDAAKQYKEHLNECRNKYG